MPSFHCGPGGKIINPGKAGENALGVYNNRTPCPDTPSGFTTCLSSFTVLHLVFTAAVSQGRNPSFREAGTRIVCSIAGIRTDIYILRPPGFRSKKEDG